jgi:hypothetical protein
MPDLQDKTFENCRLIFRNFSGKATNTSREGRRYFFLLLDDVTAKNLANKGWNVKYLKPKEESETSQAYLRVLVNYKGPAPSVVMNTSRGEVPLTEGTIGLLDKVEIKDIIVTVHPRKWEVKDKSGVEAYLQTLTCTKESI